MMQAQHYTAFARTYRNKSNVDLEIVISTWMDQLPYADGGGDMVDSQPILSVIEFFVTPFDHLIWDAPEESVISDLFEGKTIGFALSLMDMDSETSGTVPAYSGLTIGWNYSVPMRRVTDIPPNPICGLRVFSLAPTVLVTLRWRASPGPHQGQLG